MQDPKMWSGDRRRSHDPRSMTATSTTGSSRDLDQTPCVTSDLCVARSTKRRSWTLESWSWGSGGGSGVALPTRAGNRMANACHQHHASKKRAGERTDCDHVEEERPFSRATSQHLLTRVLAGVAGLLQHTHDARVATHARKGELPLTGFLGRLLPLGQLEVIVRGKRHKRQGVPARLHRADVLIVEPCRC